MILFSFINLHSHLSNKVRKPTGYRTSINELNVHTKIITNKYYSECIITNLYKK